MIRSYAQRIDRAKALLGGLAAHADKLEKWGITPEYMDKLNTLYKQTTEIEQKRNALKASSQLATAEQDRVMAELENNCGIIRRLIRFELPKESWPEFGFRQGEYAEKKEEEPAEPKEMN